MGEIIDEAIKRYKPILAIVPILSNQTRLHHILSTKGLQVKNHQIFQETLAALVLPTAQVLANLSLISFLNTVEFQRQ